MSVPAPRGDVRLTGAEPKAYRKIGDSSRARIQLFCPNCRTPVFTTGEGAESGVLGIRWGSTRQRRALAPKHQIRCRSALPWLGDVARLPSRPAE